MRFTAFVHSQFTNTSKSRWLGRREIDVDSEEDLEEALEDLEEEGLEVTSVLACHPAKKANGPTRQKLSHS